MKIPPAARCLSLLAILTAAPTPWATPADVALVLDRSGSMKRTDPHRDSVRGVELFASLLGQDDRLAFLTFAERGEARWPLTPLSGPGIRERLAVLARSVPIDGRLTDFGAALRLARQTLADPRPGPEPRRMVVLFSDGRPDLGGEAANRAAEAAILAQLPEFRTAGIKVYGVAFSPEADLAFLRRVAEATGGLAVRAEKADDIYTAFIRLFEETDRPLAVPVRDGRVAVDTEVRELKLLVGRDSARERIRLIDPAGQEFGEADRPPGLEWQHTGPFDRITVTRPATGAWQVLGSSGEKKAYLDSDLDLGVELPPQLRAGEPAAIAVRLLYHGQTLADPRLLAGLKVAVDIRDETGVLLETLALRPDAPADNPAQIRGPLRFGAAGAYRLSVLAETPLFQRSREVSVKVLDAPPVTAPATPTALPVPSPASAPPPATEPIPKRNPLGWVVALNLILAVLAGGGIWLWRYRHGRDAEQNRALALRLGPVAPKRADPPRHRGPAP